jgi:hypothetical protein
VASLDDIPDTPQVTSLQDYAKQREEAGA